MKARLICLAALAAGCLFAGVGSFHSTSMAQDSALTPGDRVRAPEFPAGFTWYNTAKPLSLQGLRGKVVLLDFWTYGCINCMHILPDLKRLEQKYPKNLVVISVHSAKFENEKDAANIRNALLRYNIEHPVLVDQKMRVWDEYAVRAWPSFVLIDPEGRVIGQTAGEGQYDLLDETIAKSIQEFRPKGVLNETPLTVALERAKLSATPLRFPGKVAVNAGGDLAIADSNHNRIVFVNHLDGSPVAVAGSGAMGFRDGSLAEAQFHNPQGMTYDPEINVWYVADTDNHAIRAISLNDKKVWTVAGTGHQAPWGATGGEGTKAALSSPWDLYLDRYILYIAMAGTHQIWQMDFTDNKVSVFAGSGVEARTDGTRASAAFAQPSGITSDGKRLYVADSESSSIRAVDLPDTGDKVTTLAGGDLFDFGYKDGTGLNARFQHPLGVTLGPDDALYISDTYNSKIRRLDLKMNAVTTVIDRGLAEPGGICFDESRGKTLFIADTNDHQVKRLDLGSRQLSVFSTPSLQEPKAQLAAQPAGKPMSAPRAASVTVAPGEGIATLEIKLPDGYHLNYESPIKWEAKVSGNGLKLAKTKVAGKDFKLPVRIPFTAACAGQGTLHVSAIIGYCSSGKGAICKLEKVERTLDFEVSAAGQTKIELPGASLEP